MPFLDTDIARAVVTLTIDDFAFFVEEYELDHSLVLALSPVRNACSFRRRVVGGELGMDNEWTPLPTLTF